MAVARRPIQVRTDDVSPLDWQDYVQFVDERPQTMTRMVLRGGDRDCRRDHPTKQHYSIHLVSALQRTAQEKEIGMGSFADIGEATEVHQEQER